MADYTFVFGTRPEFIKLYPLIREAKRRDLDVAVVSTGQHREMLDPILARFGVVPDHDLRVMEDVIGLHQIVARSLERLDPILAADTSTHVIVHGDTAATVAGSLAAVFHQLPLSHIEAGLRTGNKFSPFPEEMNRRVAGVLADNHFAPTDLAAENLRREGISSDRVHVVGNSAIDMLAYTIDEGFTSPLMDQIGERQPLLVTVHRRENLDRMVDMFRGIDDVARLVADRHDVIFPIHMNPLVRRAADEAFTSPNVVIVEPLETIEFHNLMARSILIMTDSGGIQEEAPSLGKPVLVLRDETERPEGVEAGTLRLIGGRRDDIVAHATELLSDEAAYQAMAGVKNPYGDGSTAPRVFDILTHP